MMRGLLIAIAVVSTLIDAASAQQQRYAVIDANGNVVNVINAAPSYSAPDGMMLVQTDVAGPGWKWSQNGGFVAPAVSSPTIATAMRVVSISTPALNGTYSTDPQSQQKVQAISLYVAVNGRFPAAQTTEAWPDVSGTMHQFQTTAQWQAFATAMGDFVAALDLGQTPMQPVTIP